MPDPALRAIGLMVLLAAVACDGGVDGVLADDPLTLSFEGEGPEVAQLFGVGDIQGDGVDDLVVVMALDGSAWDFEETAGLGVFAGDEGRPDDTLASYVQGPEVWLLAGGLGDIDGDGRVEVAVAAREYDSAVSEPWIYSGTEDGLSDDPRALYIGGLQLRASLSGDGDLDGDGVRDLVVAVDDDALTVAVFLGGDGEPLTVSGSEADGGEVYGLGDVNGDGYDEVTVGDASAQVFDVYAWGGGRGPALLQTLLWEGDDGVYGMVPVGDVDGDGTDEIAVTRPGDDAAPAMLYAGSPEGVVLDPLVTLHSPDEPVAFGTTMTSVARDGGVAALVLCDPYIDWSQGAAYLFLAGADGFTDEPTASFAGTSEGWRYARVAADAGDLNHDGVSDLALGGEGSDGRSGLNKVYFLAEDLGGQAE